jgi:hypothetical protein
MNTSAVVGSSVVVYANGNLSASNSINAGFAPRMQCHSNIGMTTGKWYAEFTNITTRQVGISKGDYLTYSGTGVDSLIAYYNDGSYSATTGSSGTFSGPGGSFTSTDVVGVAVDVDNATVTWYVNGASRLVITNIASSTRPTLPWYFSSNPSTSGAPSTVTANFGQRAWAYTPPAGFNALTTKNLPRPVVGSAAATPNQYFDAVLYTGTGAAQTITLPGAFKPDLVWIKDRTAGESHELQDSVRGATKPLWSNLTTAESTSGNTLTSFDASGFTISTSTEINRLNDNYVAWCWKAGGTAVSNTAGTITSSVSANTSSGFSIIGYTGTGSMSQTIGHGLGVAPSVVIFKNRTTGSTDWNTYAPSTSGFTRLKLNTSAADYVSYPITVSSTTITLPAINDVAFSSTSNNYIVYAWAEIAGFSKFGAYTGNGSTDGTFIYCGFKPRWIMVKEATGTNAATGSWQIFDTARDLGNPSDNRLKANISDAEAGSAPSWDVVSNGFKLRSTNSNWNESAGVYFYMAFAGSPFGNVNGTAR